MKFETEIPDLWSTREKVKFCWVPMTVVGRRSLTSKRKRITYWLESVHIIERYCGAEEGWDIMDVNGVRVT